MDNKEDQIALARAKESAEKCDRENRIIVTEFFDMRMQGLISTHLKNLPGIPKHFSYGGYENSERRAFVFIPDWADEQSWNLDSEDEPFCILRVLHKMGGRELSHRDYLGSILGLGLSRSKIGDIIVYEKGADIIIDKTISEFLEANYFKAGRTELSLSIEPLEKLNLSEIRTELITDTLASLRLDAFLASAYRCSRTKAQEAIKQGIVFVNNAQCIKPDKELELQDSVSVRGKGKCILEEIGGTSKKDRTFITIKKYL